MPFLLFLILLMLIGGMSDAASTASLVLKGTVTADYQITSVPTPSADTLDIVNGETNKLVADITEYTNNPSGYKVTASSSNGGLLKNGTIDQTAYTLSYAGGSPVTLSSSPSTVKTAVSAGTQLSEVKVSVTARPGALMGTYTDTVTLSIEAP